MRTLAWLGLGLFAFACGGNVVGLMGVDAGSGGGADTAPPQRGPTDTALAPEAGPPPMDTGAAVDVPSVVDSQPDRVVDTGVGPPIVDAGPDVVLGRVCQVANATACPAGSYCLSANCVSGNCVVAPPSDLEAAVCGCDRVTYWNGALAASTGASVRVTGACPVGIACAAAGGNNCQNGTFCNLQVASAAACTADPPGRCWALPNVCPPAATSGGATSRRCTGNNACADLCDMIRDERIFFVDDTCP